MVSGVRCADCREPIHEAVADVDAETLCKQCREVEREEIESIRAEERRQPYQIESHGPSNFGRLPGEIPGSAVVSALAKSQSESERQAILEFEGRPDRGFGIVVLVAGGATMLLWAFCWWLDEFIESLPPL